jgi:hypothetical protein
MYLAVEPLFGMCVLEDKFYFSIVSSKHVIAGLQDMVFVFFLNLLNKFG